MQLATSQPNNVPAKAPALSMLARATRGKIQTPFRVLIFGPEKVGKSSFANGAPSAIYLDTEAGTDEIDIQNRIQIGNWTEFMATLHELLETDHSFKSLVIDSATAIERMAGQEVCSKANKTSLADFAHGRGFTAMYGLFDSAMLIIERLFREKRMNVIVVAHSKIETFKNPDGDDFDRYAIDLSRHVGGVLKKWAKAVLFARFETLVDTADAKERHGKGVGGRTRKLMCVGCDAYEAGNRHSLPESLELSWAAFEAAAADGAEKENRILADIREAMAFISPEKQTLAERSIEACKGDAAKLSQTLNWVRNQQEKSK